jgi:hypothetical protein
MLFNLILVKINFAFDAVRHVRHLDMHLIYSDLCEVLEAVKYVIEAFQPGRRADRHGSYALQSHSKDVRFIPRQGTRYQSVGSLNLKT